MMCPIKIKRLNSKAVNFQTELDQLLLRNQTTDPTVDRVVVEIINEVKRNGDQALYAYTKQFEHFDLNQETIKIPEQRLNQALQSLSDEQHKALQDAAERIRLYHQHQKQESWEYTEEDGSRFGQKITALQRVGVYVPGGKAAYPSSVLMNTIPAKVAGVKEITMVTPTPGGELNDVVLAAAKIAGVDTVLRIGGAQAVAALAYGTESVTAVDKIVGPGNIYVATAKKQVFGKVGIDMIAGPSEVLIIADDSVNPDWVAMDLFAQAEHDEMAQAILLSQSEAVLDSVLVSVNQLLPSLERVDSIVKSLNQNGAFIVADSDHEVVRIANCIATEHLEVFTRNAQQLVDRIDHAGAIFVGKYSAEALGDYCAGPNHVLPTSGTARFSSPLGVYDFQKRSSIIHCSKRGAEKLAKTASVLARSEALTAHARSAEYRIKNR